MSCGSRRSWRTSAIPADQELADSGAQSRGKTWTQVPESLGSTVARQHLDSITPCRALQALERLPSRGSCLPHACPLQARASPGQTAHSSPRPVLQQEVHPAAHPAPHLCRSTARGCKSDYVAPLSWGRAPQTSFQYLATLFFPFHFIGIPK